MVERIDTERVQELIALGAVVLEVLPAAEFEREHLPGARSIPLADLTAGRVADLDRAAPVVAYCFDYQ